MIPASDPKGDILIESIADGIVWALRPSTVLDVGCGRGALVEALRRHGVWAFGVWTPPSPAESPPGELPPYCWAGSVSDPFPQKYDLIVCMEILGRVPSEMAVLAVGNLCQHSDEILFSPLAPGSQEPPPWSVHPAEYWAGLFADHGFFRDINFDASFVGVWAMRFLRVHEPLRRVIASYERRLRHLARESQVRREYGIEQHNELAAKEREIRVTEERHEEYERGLKAQLADTKAQLEGVTSHLLVVSRQLGVVSRRLDEVLGSRSWRLMRRVQQVRLRLIPLGSRRERWLGGIVHLVRVWRETGPREFVRRARRKMARGAASGVRRARRWMRGRRGPSEQIAFGDINPLPPLGRRTIAVDIVVCVHDALGDVKNCLESIIRWTSPSYSVMLVDDGSGEETREMLGTFARSQNATLLRNETARGYTRAANQGLRHSTARYVVLLNSDTVVTPRWLDRLIVCAESDPRIGLVGPLSNAASWQSIPEPLTPAGELAENPLPAGMTAAAMAETVARYSGRVYPRLPFLNGFCLLLKRQVIEEVGYLDEETFGDGYGEENDYCLRAGKAGWQLAAADDAYVFHAQSRSYSHERRRELSQRSDLTLIEKHGSPDIYEGVLICRSGRVIQGVRARSRVVEMREKLIEEGQKRWEGKRLLFVLPVTEPAGGGHVVIQEAEAMRRMGVDVRLLNLAAHRADFEHWHPDNPIPVEYVERPGEAGDVLDKYDAMIGTVYHSMKWLQGARTASGVIRGYYIQDFEPFFFPKGSPEHREAWESYTSYPDLVRITKTEWTQKVVREQIGTDCVVVGPSVAIDLFRPRRRRTEGVNGTIRVAAMVRPSTPRRGTRLTMEVLRDLDRRHAWDVEIVLFGCGPDELELHRLPTDFSWQHAGILPRIRMAALLNEVDILIDLSEYQAMGLTAMEAMACGAAVILPQEGGAVSFAKHEENALTVDTRSREECLSALERLVRDDALRRRLGEEGMRRVCQYPPEVAAYRVLGAVFGEVV